MTEAAPNAAPAGDAGQAAGQGNQAPWYKTESYGFSPEEVGAIENKGWKDSPKQMLGAYSNLEKFHGVPAEQLLKLPKDPADEKSWGDVYKRLGRPDAADKYGEFNLPEEFKGVEMDKDRIKWADEQAFALGLNARQRNALIANTIKYETGIYKDAETKIAQIMQTQLDGLKTEWGQHFPEREELGRRSARMVLPGDEAQKDAHMKALEGALGTAAFLKMFANIGDKLPGVKEDKMHGTDGARSFGYTKEQALDDIKTLKAEIGADPKRLADFNKNTGPDVEKLKRLHSIAYPSKAS
jgi:hypothetical protein